MRKEQISQVSQPQNPRTRLGFNHKSKTTHHISKNQKQIKKKRPRSTKKTKSTASIESALSTEPTPTNIIQNTLQTTSLNLPSPLNISIQDFICAPIPNQEQIQANLAQVNQYLGTIGEYYLERQARFPLPPLQYSISFGPNQRLRLIGLISLHCSKLKLSLQTQFLALDIFHRICTSSTFERYHSSLKAASALYVAAKYQQSCAPESHYFSTLDPNQRILPQNIVKLEALIMIHLDFNLSYPVPLNFVQLLAVRFQLNLQARQSLIRLCKRAIYRQDLWLGKASLLAMSCFCFLFGRVKEWQQVDELRCELDWRISTLQQHLGQ